MTVCGLTVRLLVRICSRYGTRHKEEVSRSGAASVALLVRRDAQNHGSRTKGSLIAMPRGVPENEKRCRLDVMLCGFDVESSATGRSACKQSAWVITPSDFSCLLLPHSCCDGEV